MRRILTLAATLGLAAAACGSDDDGSGADGDAVGIVVTTSIHGDIVRSAFAALGEDVEVEVVMPLGADPHDFEPSARQAEAMEDADLLVVNGGGLEEGLSGVIDAVAASGTPVFAFADHVELADDHGDDDHGDDDHGDDDHGDDDHGDDDHDQHGEDPHVWEDPMRVVAVVEALGDELVGLGLDGADVASSTAAYVAELTELDERLADRLAAVPEERRALVTNHDAFGYFAERYGFDVLGTVIPSMTTTAEASAAELEALADLVRERGLPAIFAETTESDRLARALADEVGSDVSVVELYSGSLGEPGSGADTYVGYMTTNAELIASALA